MPLLPGANEVVLIDITAPRALLGAVTSPMQLDKSLPGLLFGEAGDIERSERDGSFGEPEVRWHVRTFVFEAKCTRLCI